MCWGREKCPTPHDLRISWSATKMYTVWKGNKAALKCTSKCNMALTFNGGVLEALRGQCWGECRMVYKRPQANGKSCDWRVSISNKRYFVTEARTVRLVFMGRGWGRWKKGLNNVIGWCHTAVCFSAGKGKVTRNESTGRGAQENFTLTMGSGDSFVLSHVGTCDISGFPTALNKLTHVKENFLSSMVC